MDGYFICAFLTELRFKTISFGYSKKLSPKRWSVEFKNVNFQYNPDRQILKDGSFLIQAGKTLAIVGPSGSGKSTLARLLFRFYDVTAGSIRIGDVDLRDVTQNFLRHSSGIVPQDTVLFNDSIGYNIHYGRPTASDQEVRDAAKLAKNNAWPSRVPF